MDDFFSVFKSLRKVEALFLPFFPARWQETPPSYRIVSFWIERLRRGENKSEWRAALLYSMSKGFYRAYHQMGLISEGRMSPLEMRWMRLVLAMVAMVVAVFFIPQAKEVSPLVKGILLLGSCTLLIFGSMRLSVSALWASWGLLFPVLGFVALRFSPWGMLFLASWALVWHTPALKQEGTWRWFDWLATLPILFFWMTVVQWDPAWTACQNGYLSVLLWSFLWAGQVWARKHQGLSRALQLFWPSSILCIVLVAAIAGTPFAGSPFYKTWCWPLWLTSTSLLSLLIALLSRWLACREILFRFSVFVAVFALFGLSIFLLCPDDELYEVMKHSQSYLHSATWPLWWFIGAGIIMLIRRSALVLFNWAHALLPFWLLPVALLVFPALSCYFDWFPLLIQAVTKQGFLALSVVFASVAAFLAWRRKEIALREWVFWGVYFGFLLQRYWWEANRLAYGNAAEQGSAGFLLLALWLMWLSYHVVGESLAPLRKEGGDKISAVALMGAFLWLLTSSLWSIYVDQNLSIRKEIDVDLFMGFNFFGVSFIIYNMIVRKYVDLESDQTLPWHWILLLGVGLVQILQGVEHYVAAWTEGQSLTDLHVALHKVYVDLTLPLKKAAPQSVFLPSWVIPWRLARWVTVMTALTLLIQRADAKAMPRAMVISLTCLTSLAACVTESYWFIWPSMPPFLSVVFRPWQVDKTVMGWDLGFLVLFAPYAVTGLAWGWLLGKARRP